MLSREAFVLRYFDGARDDRLVLINLGRELAIDPAPEPLLAPPAGAHWELRWSSEAPRYGGFGPVPAEGDEGWRLAAESATVLRPAPDPDADA